MMSEMSESLSNSSSGPKPSSSSTSTFSSANCSRRLRVILSSASTSRMIGRNSSVSSSLLNVAAASGSTRSSRRGSTCSLILWTDCSNPCGRSSTCSCNIRVLRRLIASSEPLAIGSLVTGGKAVGSIGGNWLPPCSSRAVPPPLKPCIGLATPKAGRADCVPGFRPNALMACTSPIDIAEAEPGCRLRQAPAGQHY